MNTDESAFICEYHTEEMKFNYIYGPVPSWRLANSLGIDPISSDRKVCTFDCIYCQLGHTPIFSKKRKVYVKTKKIIEELKSLPKVKLDYITFSGMGEPTLARNLGRLIRAIRKIRKEKVAVLTNSSLMDRKDVRDDLGLADFVIAKLDAPSQKLFKKINRPMQHIKFGNILEGIKRFRKDYKGRLGLQIMFVNENKNSAAELAKIVTDIKPDEVQINTPLRPCAVEPLSRKELLSIRRYFLRIPGFEGKVVSVYDARFRKTVPISLKGTSMRRGGGEDAI